MNILMVFFVAICLTSRAGQEPAFVLSGSFDDTFAGKHGLAGSFTVNAFGSNALIDMTFENGVREVVGTDGHDTFHFYPITDDLRAKFPDPNGLADISNGRFPIDAHFMQQALWLVCVHDPELITNLPNTRFQFYGYHNTTDIVSQVITSSDPPNLITSIKWYAPNTMGPNHYKIAMYPDGWLLADLTVTKTELIDNVTIPGEVRFNQYVMRTVDRSQFGNLPIRGSNDVEPVEVALISITDSQVSSPLPSYIPMILDKTARINDKRINDKGFVSTRVLRVDSGKWWTVREFYKARMATVRPRRKVIRILLLISLLFPIYLLIRMGRSGKKQTKNDNQS